METKMNQNRVQKETKTGKVRVSDKEMVPQELQLPGTRPTDKEMRLWTP
jgi:hypothetical protein